MKKVSMSVAAAIAFAVSGTALACGVCIEDKVAATYDHHVIRAAISSRSQVIFVALDGRDGALIGERITAAASRVRGIDVASVRYAASPPALSFALAQGVAPDVALHALTRGIKGADVRMRIIRIMRDGALIDPT
jgi:hypothetical protein